MTHVLIYIYCNQEELYPFRYNAWGQLKVNGRFGGNVASNFRVEEQTKQRISKKLPLVSA
jgi:hypothetical protein